MINMGYNTEITDIFHGCKGKKKSDWGLAISEEP
jgi:hypothetical protein